MANIPFAEIADLMNRLLEEAAEHRRRRIYRERKVNWPPQWWHCPNPPADQKGSDPKAAA